MGRCSMHNTDSSTGKGVTNPFRHIELDIDIGADAKDWSAVQATEKLKPVETELRRIEEMLAEIVSEMDYLRTREQKLRDTNESTNNRVKWFAFSTMGMLVALGAWQVIYLRAYFRYVYTILFWGLPANKMADRSILSKYIGYQLSDASMARGRCCTARECKITESNQILEQSSTKHRQFRVAEETRPL